MTKKKRTVAAVKAARTRKLRAAGKKAAVTRRRKATARKAAAARRLSSQKAQAIAVGVRKSIEKAYGPGAIEDIRRELERE
jgi:hypothetical protein